jgi:hypothetical protein
MRQMIDLRSEIKSQVGKIPMRVMQGSVQEVVRWKERANEALRLAQNKNTSNYDLQIALDRIK